MADRVASRRQAESRGRRSETLASLLLILKGYRILARRARTYAGEIDLVAHAPGGVVCFVEVKARTDASAMAEALGERQRGRIARAAEAWLAQRPGLRATGIRFDIVAVAPRAWPRHIRDAWRP